MSASDREFLEALYEDLRAQARRWMKGQRPSHTLQATALVNEAYLKLARGTGTCWEDRRHFLAAASSAMRQILIDHARAKKRLKRQAPGQREPLDEVLIQYDNNAFDLEALDSALEELARFNPEMARAVELRFFGAATVEETASILDMSRRTFERRWQAARAWLHARLS